MKLPVQGLIFFYAKIHGFGTSFSLFSYTNKGHLDLDLYRKNRNHAFSLKKFSRPCTGHFIGQKCYFCIAESSGVQKNTTFFDEVLWGVIQAPPL